MRQGLKILITISLIGVALFCFSCAKKQVRDDSMAGQETTTGDREGVEEGKLEESDIDSQDFQEISESDTELLAVFTDIRFDYDDFSLRPDAKTILDGIADWLLKNTAKQVLVEGHCDERGANEYNLALGERRANSAKKYLAQLGVAPKRVSTISYGEEKPLDSAGNEESWTKNRRDHFLIK
jgi:peptidoglycan-associated lipoprotein